MPGFPTTGELEDQLAKAVDCLEAVRNFVDGTMAGSSGKWDTLIGVLEGQYTPETYSDLVTQQRNALADMISDATILPWIRAFVNEYGPLLDSHGAGYQDDRQLAAAVYKYFHENTKTVQSRAITFDTSKSGSTTGNGAISRLTVDENGYNLEGATVEKKTFRCVFDQNNGAYEDAEEFEVLGAAAGPDSILRASFGGGVPRNNRIISSHAGSANGGSILNNSSFSSYNSALTTTKFTSWTFSSGDAGATQDTTDFYRSFPNAATDASLAASTDFLIKQTVAQMRVNNLNRNVPYFVRVMFDEDTNAATGGTLTVRLGSQSESVSIGANGAGWHELLFTPGTKNWFANFNEDGLDFEIEWSGRTGGTLLVDDVVVVPWYLVDGTYWNIRGNASSHTPWKEGDEFSLTDTGGAPSTGKIQYYWWRSGYGYLPSSGTPSVSDP